jgi:peptidyl-prolyl cis-trans isomerase C/peptidyl-prolyl cis-trans isomerase D
MKSFQAFALFLFCFNFAVSAFAQGKEVVAVVGSKTITLDEFNKKYSEIRGQTINPPTKEQFLEDMVRYEVGLQEAEKRKIQNDPIVQERMRQEIYKALLEKDLGERVQKITVSDKEMEAYHKKNPEIRTSHILFEVRPGATAEQRSEAKKRAEDLYSREIKNSKRPFEELVKLYSDDPLSKQAGGDIGWGNRVAWVPSYYEAALKMNVGEVSGVIETQFGFHIIKVTGRRSYDNANKRTIRAAVFDEKRRDVFNDYFEKLKKGYKIQTNQRLIN